MAEQITLLGEQGRRRERLEWAVKYPGIPRVFPAGTAPAEDRAHAEEMADNGGPGYRVVCRTVVSYTTDWRAPVEREG